MSEDQLGKAERTRRFIIERSAPIFNKKGYAGTSLSDITQAAGLSKGSIYGNFKDKDEVAACAFDHNIGFIMNAITREMEQAKNSREMLLAYPRGYRKIYKQVQENGGCPIFNMLTEADDTHEALLQKALDFIDFWRGSIIEVVEKGIKDKEFSADVVPERIAAIIISCVGGTSILSKATNDETYILHSLEFAEAMIKTLSAPSGPMKGRLKK